MKFPRIRRGLYWPFFLALALVNIVTSVGVSNAASGSGPLITQLTVFTLTGLVWLSVAAARRQRHGQVTMVGAANPGTVRWLGHCALVGTRRGGRRRKAIRR